MIVNSIRLSVADLEAAIVTQDKIRAGHFITDEEKRNHHLVCLRFRTREFFKNKVAK